MEVSVPCLQMHIFSRFINFHDQDFWNPETIYGNFIGTQPGESPSRQAWSNL